MPRPKQQQLERVHPERRDDSVLNVIFVHGLGSDGDAAWTNKAVKPAFYWPLKLAEDHPKVCVWKLSYAANPLEVFSSETWRAMPLQDRAASVINTLVGERIADKPIVFVTHSLGGLLVKQVLQHGQFLGPPEWRRVWMNTQAVFFIATPHQGSVLSDFSERLVSVIARRNPVLRWILRLSPAMRDLRKNNPLIRYLLLWYGANAKKAGIKTVAFFETSGVAGVTVVDSGSAGAQSSGTELVPVEADHIGISKPLDRQHPVYSRVSEYLRSSVEHLERGTIRPVFRQAAALANPKLNDIPREPKQGETRLRQVKRITHDIEAMCRDGRLEISREDHNRAAASEWDVDRIILYICEEYSGSFDKNDPHRHVQSEYELVKATPIDEERGAPSTIPLYYAARSLDRATEDRSLSAQTRKDLEVILGFLEERKPRLDGDDSVKDRLRSVIARCTQA